MATSWTALCGRDIFPVVFSLDQFVICYGSYVMLFNLAFALITALPVKRFKGSTFLVIFTQRVFADHLAFIPRFIISTATFLLLWVVVGGAVYTLHSII